MVLLDGSRISVRPRRGMLGRSSVHRSFIKEKNRLGYVIRYFCAQRRCLTFHRRTYRCCHRGHELVAVLLDIVVAVLKKIEKLSC